VDLGQTLLSGVVSAVVGGFVAWLVARRQRGWADEAVRREHLDTRLLAAQGVLVAFLDRVERAERSGIPTDISFPYDQMSAADWLALWSVRDLFAGAFDNRDRPRPALFYPPSYLGPDGSLADGRISGAQWDPVRAQSQQTLNRITAERAHFGSWGGGTAPPNLA
jgi:hypothetical protein